MYIKIFICVYKPILKFINFIVYEFVSASCAKKTNLLVVQYIWFEMWGGNDHWGRCICPAVFYRGWISCELKNKLWFLFRFCDHLTFRDRDPTAPVSF